MRTTIPITGPDDIENGTKLVYPELHKMPDGHGDSYWLVSEKAINGSFFLTYHYGNPEYKKSHPTTRVGKYSIESIGGNMHKLVTELAYDPEQQGDRDDDI